MCSSRAPRPKTLDVFETSIVGLRKFLRGRVPPELGATRPVVRNGEAANRSRPSDTCLRETTSDRRVDGRADMGTTENKAVVRRFWNELIIGGNLEVADELLAPNYVNLIVEGLAD